VTGNQEKKSRENMMKLIKKGIRSIMLTDLHFDFCFGIGTAIENIFGS
jgi:hypothetical protein